MVRSNRTIVTEFLLLGFGNLYVFKTAFFLLFVAVYSMSLVGNSLVVSLVVSNRGLHSPMYFFLIQVSLCDILFTTSIAPNVARLALMDRHTMPVKACIIQLCFLGVPTIGQCLLLAAMSFDRYVAICNPLHYKNIMTSELQLRISVVCWSLGLLLSLLELLLLDRLEFCDSNVIDHFYCDIPPVLELSCSDTSPVELVTSLASVPVVLFPLLFIVATYVSILHTILGIPSVVGRQKAFSTCSSHLGVVCMYYGTLTALYVFPHKENIVNLNKSLSLMYTLVTPLFNPIIYSLRNQEIGRAIQKSVRTLKTWTDLLIYAKRSHI